MQSGWLKPSGSSPTATQGKVFRLSLNRTTPIYACRKAFATDLSLPNSVNVPQSTTKRIARKSKIECTDHMGQYFLINFYLKKNLLILWYVTVT